MIDPILIGALLSIFLGIPGIMLSLYLKRIETQFKIVASSKGMIEIHKEKLSRLEVEMRQLMNDKERRIRWEGTVDSRLRDVEGHILEMIKKQDVILTRLEK